LLKKKKLGNTQSMPAHTTTQVSIGLETKKLDGGTLVYNG